MSPDYDELAHRYVALWNEADDALRRRTVAALFAPDVMHCTRSLEANGLAEMEQRVIGSHRKWVRDAGCRFEPVGHADGHHDVVRLRWQMLSPQGGAASLGSDVLVLAPDGRIRLDYQFIDQNPEQHR